MLQPEVKALPYRWARLHAAPPPYWHSLSLASSQQSCLVLGVFLKIQNFQLDVANSYTLLDNLKQLFFNVCARICGFVCAEISLHVSAHA